MENIWALYYSSCSKNVGNTPKIQPPFIWSFTVKFYCMYLYLNNQTVAVSLYKLCASISKGAQTCSPQPKFETSPFCFLNHIFIISSSVQLLAYHPWSVSVRSGCPLSTSPGKPRSFLAAESPDISCTMRVSHQ